MSNSSLRANRIAALKRKSAKHRAARPQTDPFATEKKVMDQFRRMLPGLTSYASMMAGRRMPVVIGANNQTDSHKIELRPPSELASMPQHALQYCGQRDSRGMMRCRACHVREQISGGLHHEIAHIIFNSFETRSEEDWVMGLRREIEDCYDSDKYTKLYMTTDATIKLNWPAKLFAFDPWFGTVLMAIEDVRINLMSYNKLPGLEDMQRARILTILMEGVRLTDGTVAFRWSEKELEMQLIALVLFQCQGFPEVRDYMHQDAVDVFDHPVFDDVRLRISKPQSLSIDSAANALRFLSIARSQFGLFSLEENAPEPGGEEPSEGEPGESDESTPSDGSSPGGSGNPSNSDPEDEESDDTDVDSNGDGDSDGDSDSDSDQDGEEKDEEGEGQAGEEDSDQGEDASDQDNPDGEAEGDDTDSASSDDGDSGENAGEGDGDSNSPAPSRARNTEEVKQIIPALLGHDPADLTEPKPQDKSGPGWGEGKGQKKNDNDEIDDKTMTKVIQYLELLDGVSENLGAPTLRTAAEYDNSLSPYSRSIPPLNLPPQALLGRAVTKLRFMLAKNKREDLTRNQTSGRIATNSLGKRAPFNDGRIFARRKYPTKRDYHVLVGLDVSGSTQGYALSIIKSMSNAIGETLHRAGIDTFEMWAHSTEDDPNSWNEYGPLWIEVKSTKEKWGVTVKSRLASLRDMDTNTDGRNLQFYRKQLDKSSATDKIMIYVTDGAIPGCNYGEEIEIFRNEVDLCRKKKYAIIGVGIGTDSPKEFGLETVVVDSENDIEKVVDHLQEHIK